MSSVTKSNQGNDVMADQEPSEDANAPSPDSNVLDYRAPAIKGGRRTGFFTIYKKGQGYWTRMGTALAAGLIAVLFAQFVYNQMHSTILQRLPNGELKYIPASICAGVAGAILLIFLFFSWRFMNKPTSVDFLIATDSEMKKVNWTTRKELIGSTKVVIFFVVLISLILFLLDVIFGYFFQLIKVLEFGPFQ